MTPRVCPAPQRERGSGADADSWPRSVSPEEEGRSKHGAVPFVDAQAFSMSALGQSSQRLHGVSQLQFTREEMGVQRS